ncbi:MAG TPA: threonine/serine dehydratase [Woeseiaceae bacterium]|nr:threonine/serine dehydratase [Woeseiaceae bacterium]
MIDIADIEDAARRLRGIAIETPLIENYLLNEVAGGRVLLKAECLQRTGSFKIRGAYNLMSRLSKSEASRGVVAWSSGNHAQGVAEAARLLNMQAAIVMPEDAPQAKIDNTKRLGGEVILYDRYTGDREKIARALAAERGVAIVPSYDHNHIIAGQGTMGLEVAEQMRGLDIRPDQVLICCGGGGLTSGSAVALHARIPGVQVVAVEPAEFDDTARSFASGKREAIRGSARSICDALQTPMPGELTFAINQSLGVTAALVSDDEVAHAMRFAFRELKLVVEPGGAVALAAVLAGKVATRERTTVAVLSGGNVDAQLFARIQSVPD